MAKNKTKVNNDPPTIYYSDSPAVLVLVNENPVKNRLQAAPIKESSTIPLCCCLSRIRDFQNEFIQEMVYC